MTAQATGTTPLEPHPVDETSFRRVLGHFASGLVVVAGMHDDQPYGLVCQSFMSLSLQPPLIAIAPSRASASWARIESSGAFCANVLSAHQDGAITRFGRPGVDKFASIDWSMSRSGSPRLADATAWIDCRIDAVHSCGDHYLVVGAVLDVAARPSDPLIFYRGRYTTVR